MGVRKYKAKLDFRRFSLLGIFIDSRLYGSIILGVAGIRGGLIGKMIKARSQPQYLNPPAAFGSEWATKLAMRMSEGTSSLFGSPLLDA